LLRDDEIVTSYATFACLYEKKLKEEGKAIVLQSAVDAIRQIANINLGA